MTSIQINDRPIFETMENRTYFAASPVHLGDRLLYISGTAGNDRIFVFHNKAQDKLTVRRNGADTTYDMSVVGLIQVKALGGDDVVHIATSEISAEIYGGDGNDDLQGVEAGPQHIF